MDSESCNLNNEQGKQKKVSNSVSDDRDVSEPFRIRRGSIDVDRFNRILLECEFGYVLPCGIILWTLFLIFWK
jgi:hypothetical protein